MNLVSRRYLARYTRNRGCARGSCRLGAATWRVRQRMLTPRELEVAALVAEGLDNAEIASRLTLSRPTIAGHVAKILKKLGAKSRVQIAVWVTEQRLRRRQ